MNQNFKDKINDYLEGKLNATDLAAFEEAMSADETLLKAVEVSRLEKQSIELLIENDLRAKMQTWKKDRLTQKPEYTEGGVFKQKTNYWSRLGLFIALLLGVLGAFIYWFNKKEPVSLPQTKETPLDTLQKEQKQTPIITPNPNIAIEKKGKKPILKKQDLTTKKEDADIAFVNSMYDKPDFTNDVREIDTDKNDEDNFNSIAVAWKNDDFSKVIALTQTINPNNSNYFRCQELLGHAYFRTYQFSKAENTFNLIAQTGQGQMVEDANWYRILCLIAMHKKDIATTLLNTLLNDKKHLRNDDAQKLNVMWQGFMRK
jgi:hypothetical protein